MKRFLVFIYPDYYPGGGVNDIAGDFDTLEDNTVTLRDRDTGEQERVAIDDLLVKLK